MNGVSLKFYTYELEKQGHHLLYEWLLEMAKKQGLPGGSVIRAIAGFGHHKKLHEEHFFELAANVPVEIQFILSKEQATQFLNLLKQENIHLFYTLSPIEYNTIP